MATPVTYTIGKTSAPESRDYSSISNFEADIGVGIAGDLTTADEVWTVNVYEDTGVTITESACTINPVTDATRNITITPAAGHALYDNLTTASALIDSVAHGVHHTFSGTFAAGLTITGDVNVIGLQYRATGNRGGVIGRGSSGTLLLSKSIFHTTHATGRECVAASSTTNDILDRLLIITGAGDRSGLVIGYGVADSVNRCTVVSTNSSSATGVSSPSGTVALNQTAIFGFATATNITTGDYNASDDTSTPGANSRDSLVFSDQFESILAGSSGDWRIKSTSTLKDNGTTSGFSVDIIGTTLGSPEDIGAWEYPAAGGVSGTLAFTLDDITAAMTGVVEVTGTIATTLDSITVAASGTFTSSSVTGTLAITLDSITPAFQGVVEVTGSLSATLDSIAVAFSGSVTNAVTGTFDITLDGIGFTATGSIGGWVIQTKDDTIWTDQTKSTDIWTLQ